VPDETRRNILPIALNYRAAAPHPSLSMNRLLITLAASALALSLAGCHSGRDSPRNFAISGSITGLSASGLVLTNNGGDSLTVLTGSNSFQFSTPVDSGGQYNVAILSQPSGLTCTVSRGSGTNVTATVNNIAIACGATTYTIAGSVSGLTASGLTIEDNGGDSLAVSENATTFQFGWVNFAVHGAIGQFRG
jgi:hypothetical protein